MDDHLVVFGKLIDAENGDDVLEFFIALKDALNSSSDGVVFFPDILRVENTRA